MGHYPFINSIYSYDEQRNDGNVSQTHKSLFYGRPAPNTPMVINENTPDIVGFPYKGKKVFVLLIHNIIGYRHILCRFIETFI